MDRFELKSEAGTGGMGTVYQAIDRRTGAVVALKVLHVRTATESARFDQEARLLAELSHPGIVRYFDRGTAPHGSPFIAMEWLEGETLEERLSRGTLGPAAVAHLACRVLEALAAAHERGVVHRDIKPSNVFLVGWKLTDTRILDFGIARRVLDPKRFTRKGSTVGTPLYASPEQARGRHDVDGRADIFSLGCVLYEALTGEPPFTGDTPTEVMQKVCAGMVAPLSSRRPNLPPDLERLIHRMLMPDPGARPLSATALAVEFRSLAQRLGDLGEETASAKPPSPLRAGCISESEERTICAMLVSLARRPVADGLRRTARDRRIGPQAAFPWQAEHKTSELKDDSPERLAALESAIRALGGEIDRLIDRTLLATAPAVGAAREQAMQMARAALVVRDMEPDAKIAIGSGRASFMARVPAGRLMDALPALMQGQTAGSIRIDENTRRLLPGRFVVGDSDGVTLLFAEAGGAGPERPRSTSGQSGRLVGRERELDLLLSLREECVRERMARAALVVGGAGIGKSRLAREFLSLSGESASNIIRCTGTLGRPETDFASLGPVLAGAGIKDIGTLAGSPCPPAMVRGEQSSPTPPATRRAAGDVKRDFVQWLQAKCADGAPIVVLEDLQWADAASVQALDEALGLLADQPLFILALGRPEVEERFPGLWGERVVECVRLAALPRRSGQSLLQLRTPPLTAEAEHFVLERWEGNPTFLEEMADALAAGRSGVPDVVLAAVEARFDCLLPEVRRVLRAASLFGDKFFSAESLVAVLGEASRREMGEWLENLVMRDLVQRQADGTEVAYRVRNKLVREAAYRMLTSADRVLGRRLARAWLQGAGRTLPDYLSGPPSQSGHRATGS
jgi:serine/threonine protein kinase